MKSFRVFLHGNNLITILSRFVWQGFARGESSITAQNVQEIIRKSKDVLPDSPKMAVINFHLTTELFLFTPLFLVEVFLDFLHELLWQKLC